MTRRAVVGALLILAWLARPAPTAAQPPSAARARALHAEGVRAYNLTEFDRAIAAFREAYQLTQRPGLLYNLAQAYRQKGDCPRAHDFYRSYLRQRPAAGDRQEVVGLIAEMETCMKAGPAASPPPTASALTVAPPPVRPLELVPPPDDDAAAAPRRWQPWAMVGAGLIVAAAGGGLLGYVDHGLAACAPRCSPSRVDELKLTAGFGYALIGVGALAGGAGLAWALVGRPRSTRAPRLTLAPGPGGLALSGSLPP